MTAAKHAHATHSHGHKNHGHAHKEEHKSDEKGPEVHPTAPEEPVAGDVVSLKIASVFLSQPGGKDNIEVPITDETRITINGKESRPDQLKPRDHLLIAGNTIRATREG